ncbi:MAG: GGDEF domain-containing protein [Deltaproteobacteria bacterium]|nr:GGDEF domain-containing protein [Deltaproteobacteria bacterium]
MRKLILVAALVAVLATVWSGSVARAEPVRLAADLRHAAIGSRLAILEDPLGAWTIDNVVHAPLTSRFAPATSSRVNFGFTGSAYWLRIELDRLAGAPTDWYLEIAYRGLDEVSLFVPSPGGHWRELVAGDLRPFTSRPVASRFPAFHLSSLPEGTSTLFLRARSAGPLVVPLDLWASDEFHEHLQTDHFELGVLLGVLIAIALQSLLSFLSLREPAYGWSFATLASLVTADAIEEGLAYQHVWPASPWWENHSFVVLAALGAGSFVGFTRRYLDTAARFPRLHRTLGRLASAWLATGLVSLVMPYAWGIRLTTGLILVTIVLSFGSAVAALRRSVRAARFYVAGLAAPFAGGIAVAFENLGWIEPSPVTRLGFEAGLLVFALLISVGLADRMYEIRRAKERAEHDSTIDELTGIPNRRSFDLVLAREWGRASRTQSTISLVMSHLDWFKRFNDAFGHLAGDQALRQVAHALRDALRRPADVIARYGGEEFAVVLPDTDAEGALHVAEALRQAVSDLELSLGPSSADGALTLSLGVATTSPQLGDDPAALVATADRALYQAKAGGRNRVAALEAELERSDRHRA